MLLAGLKKPPFPQLLDENYRVNNNFSVEYFEGPSTFVHLYTGPTVCIAVRAKSCLKSMSESEFWYSNGNAPYAVVQAWLDFQATNNNSNIF